MTDASENWYTPEVATFGDRLAAAREAASMTPEQLARRIGVKVGTLRRWEDDVSEPRANRLSMIAGLLGVSMTWLINGTGEGVSGPDESAAPSEDAQALLTELREIRLAFTSKAEQVGRIEKRLRRMIQEDQLV